MIKILEDFVVAIAILFVILAFLFSTSIFSEAGADTKMPLPGEKWNEEHYVKEACDRWGGEMEYRLEDGTRVDCLVTQMAWEFDYAHKWYECITQAMHYAISTKRQAGCFLLIKPGVDFDKYKERAGRVLGYIDFPIFMLGVTTKSMEDSYIKRNSTGL